VADDQFDELEEGCFTLLYFFNFSSLLSTVYFLTFLLSTFSKNMYFEVRFDSTTCKKISSRDIKITAVGNLSPITSPYLVSKV
jgi:hypothetical protein